ncbi:hypothetical protein MBLNU13_g06836t1 [Cladosporium sp. NU13]
MGNLAFTIRGLGRRQSAFNLISSARWEEEDFMDKDSDAICLNISDGTEEGEDDGDDDDGGEERGGQTDQVAIPVFVESLDSSLLDSAENSSVWNHPQFLWMM